MILTHSISHEVLSFDTDRRLIGYMTKLTEVHLARLTNLKKILQEECGGVIAELARRIGKDSNYTRFILNPDKTGGRTIGEKMARHIEESCGKPIYWLDQPENEGVATGPQREETEAIKSPPSPSVFEDLKNQTTLRTLESLRRIERAAREGRLSEEDAAILARIAELFAGETAPKINETGRVRKTGRGPIQSKLTRDKPKKAKGKRNDGEG